MESTPAQALPPASESEIAMVAANLKRWMPMLQEQRHVSFYSPVFAEVIREALAEDGAREEAERNWAHRARRIEELEALYGEALERVPGSLPEDLFNLDQFRLLLSAPGTNEGRALKLTAHLDLPDLISSFRREIGRGIRIEASRGPLEVPLDEAIRFKREAKYLESAKIYVEHCRRLGVAYVGWLMPLYKTVASAGELLHAWLLLRDMLETGIAIPDLEDHIPRFTEAIASIESLEDYLSQISGSAAYALPRSYRTMIDELAGSLASDHHELNADMLISLGTIEYRRESYADAADWFIRAAEAGSSEAADMLGRTRLMMRDYRAAIPWLTKSAEAGDATAMFLLADVHRRLDDSVAALDWFTKSAEAGHPAGIIGVASIHESRGDTTRQVEWLTRAAEAGSADAAALGSLASALHQLGRKQEAAGWFEKSAEGGNSHAMLPLSLYALDNGDVTTAKTWAERAASAGYPDALAHVGNYYVDRNEFAQGSSWILRAAAEGSGYATQILTIMPGLSTPEGAAKMDRAHAALGSNPKSGCYIATAVYGSYDAPPVLTLRRFRDEQLASSKFGRALIQIYYAISPALARHFEGASRLNGLTGSILDAIVRRVERRWAAGEKISNQGSTHDHPKESPKADSRFTFVA